MRTVRTKLDCGALLGNTLRRRRSATQPSVNASYDGSLEEAIEAQKMRSRVQVSAWDLSLNSGDIVMVPHASRILSVGIAAALLAACGGGGSSRSGVTPTTPTPQTGNVSMLVSDASTEDWAT